MSKTLADGWCHSCSSELPDGPNTTPADSGAHRLWVCPKCGHEEAGAPPLTEPCCATMEWHMAHHCDQHGDDCPDRVVKRSGFTGRWGLRAENAFYDLRFCPWCGAEVQDPLDDDTDEEEVPSNASQRMLG